MAAGVANRVWSSGELVELTRVGKLMRARIWLGVLIGSSIGGFIPVLWGGDLVSVSAVLLSGLGAVVGVWLGYKTA